MHTSNIGWVRLVHPYPSVLPAGLAEIVLVVWVFCVAQVLRHESEGRREERISATRCCSGSYARPPDVLPPFRKVEDLGLEERVGRDDGLVGEEDVALLPLPLVFFIRRA